MIPIPVRTAFNAFLEASLNQLLQYDPTSQARAKILQGKVIQIELKPLQPLWFVFASNTLDVLGGYEYPADASLTLTLSGLDILNRITSYNVCYTKLLRKPVVREGRHQGRDAIAQKYRTTVSRLASV